MAGKFDPQNAQNLMEIEKQFAVKAVEQAQTYWNLLEKVAPRELKLTQLDQEIFDHTKELFPELFENDNAKLIKLDEDFLKSEDGKKKWRTFHAAYEKRVKEHNFGCLIRTDANEEYGEKSTIFGMFNAALASNQRSTSQIRSHPNAGNQSDLFRSSNYSHNTSFSSTPSRNRLGLNDKAHEIAKEEAKKDAAKKEKEAKAAQKKGGK
ncbi:hypothetical protein H0H87_012797 [Tephrocybe sp. NHM501043]|nr:hypothetical protein H0H87_012797 [Tephrocybe sp. NHM501043]